MTSQKKAGQDKARHDKARKAYQFFKERLLSEEPFTSRELKTATGWEAKTFDNYWSKHWKEIIEKQRDGKFKVKPAFQYLTENRFLASWTQTSKFFVQYEKVKYEEIVQYEFLLPLTHEGQLHKALDGPFYEDTIRRRLMDIGLDQVKKWIGRDTKETYNDYIRRVCQVVSNRFKGYSISHVTGRYLAGDVTTRAKAAEMLANEEAYIIDETTAVVRFITLLETTKAITGYFDNLEGDEVIDISQDTAKEVSLVRWLFFNVFAEAVVRTVEGEDQIWLIEETPRKRRLFVWRKEESGKDQKEVSVEIALFPIK
jgi:hypothetical protein